MYRGGRGVPAVLGWKGPREARDLIFKIRSCTVRSDLKRRYFLQFLIIFKIRSCTVRSDLKNKIPRFSGVAVSSWPGRGAVVAFPWPGAAKGRGIPCGQKGGSSARGNTTTPAPWFSRHPLVSGECGIRILCPSAKYTEKGVSMKGVFFTEGISRISRFSRISREDLSDSALFSTVWGFSKIARISKIQGKTPWVDSACADCPGFLVLGAAPAPASTFASEPQIVPLA